MLKKIDIGTSEIEQVEAFNALVDAVNSLRDDCNLLMGYIAPENKCEPIENGKISKKENVERSENVQPDAKIRSENVQLDYVTTSYPTDGHTKEYYGQNGASIVTDHPLPAGYVITIRESETKGGDNE